MLIFKIVFTYNFLMSSFYPLQSTYKKTFCFQMNKQTCFQWLIQDPRHEKSKRTPDEELQTQSEDAISALTGE